MDNTGKTRLRIGKNRFQTKTLLCRYPPLAVRSKYKAKDIEKLIKKVEEVIEWLEKNL